MVTAPAPTQPITGNESTEFVSGPPSGVKYSAEAIGTFAGIREAVVYGVSVPGTEGAAGMATLTVPYGYNHGQAVQTIKSDGIVASLLDAAKVIAAHHAVHHTST